MKENRMKLVKTGIAGLDEFLNREVCPLEFCFLLVYQASGNEIFARQIAFLRAKQFGVTYFSVNETPETIREDMATYNWDTTPLETSGNWKFKTITKTGNLQESVIEEMKQNRTMLLDSLSEVLLSRKMEEVIGLLTAMSRSEQKL